MTFRIEDWICRYRLRTPAGRVRLDGLARGPVLESFERSLERALGSDPTVYLVRRVDFRWAANAADDRFARRWGETMAAAVIRAIREDAGGGNVVCYPNRTAYVTAFIEELLAGRAADSWTFAGFASFRRSTLADTLRGLLLENLSEVPAIATRLQTEGRLVRMLRALDPETTEVLWKRGWLKERQEPADAGRPFFAAAIRICERLTGRVLDPTLAEAWYRKFSEESLPVVDWRERRSLSKAVWLAVRFLREHWLPNDAWRSSSLEAALDGFDWLDLPWLRERFLVLAEPDSCRTAPIRRRRRSATPKQLEWLAALQRVLHSRVQELDSTRMDSPGNALLLCAAVAAVEPEWEGDVAPAHLVQAILNVARLLRSRVDGFSLLDGIRQSRFEALGSELEAGDSQALQTLAELGPDAADCLEVLAKVAPLSIEIAKAGFLEKSERDIGFETPTAGIFLLWRALCDLRFPALLRLGHTPEPPWRFLVGLGSRWAGMPLRPTPDPGLALFAGEDWAVVRRGLDDANCRDEAVGAWEFEWALAEVALGHGLIDVEEPIRVTAADCGGARFLFAGSESANLWPFAAPLDDGAAAGDRLQTWLEKWQERTGRPATLILPAALVGLIPHPAPMIRDEVPSSLETLCEFLGEGLTGSPRLDAAVTAAAPIVVRAWGRWLKGIGHSSVPYLLGQLIRRGGRVVPRGDRLLVELDPRPLDAILQVSGYFEPLEMSPGLPWRRIDFRMWGNR